VVSNGTTPVKTIGSLCEPHRHRAPFADKASPHRGQTMFKLLKCLQLWSQQSQKPNELQRIEPAELCLRIAGIQSISATGTNVPDAIGYSR